MRKVTLASNRPLWPRTSPAHPDMYSTLAAENTPARQAVSCLLDIIDSSSHYPDQHLPDQQLPDQHLTFSSGPQPLEEVV